MKLNRYFFVLLAAAALFAGCKKDDEDTKPSLSGTVTFGTIPAYVQKGDSFHIVAGGAYRKSRTDTLVGYCMYNPVKNWIDTLRAEGVEGPAEGDLVITKDTLVSFTMKVYAFAKGYYGTSSTAQFVVVNPSLDTLKGSLTGHPFGYGANTSFTDARDGQKYYASSVTSGGWMLQNLAWTGAGYPFAAAEAMNYIAGRFYNWDEAMAACPAGWKLPTDAEFVALAGAVTAGETIPGFAGTLKGDVSFNGVSLWPYQNSTITLTNDGFFTAMPWGYLTVSGKVTSFKQYSSMAAFWTADSVDTETARVRYLKADSNDIFLQAMDKKSFYASVRCIKE